MSSRRRHPLIEEVNVMTPSSEKREIIATNKVAIASGSKRAFLIGINYIGSPYKLGGCINDVMAIKEILISRYGFSEANILLLTDDTPIKPTGANIMDGFRWLLSKSPASAFGTGKYVPPSRFDKISYFFHYSGHGSRVKDFNNDETDGIDETICPIDFATAGMISDDIIRNSLVNQVPAGSKLFAIIDACHSASSFDLMWNVTSSNPGTFTLEKAGNYAPTNGDVVMISGCRDDQTSADITVQNKGQGALTYAILEILKKDNYKTTYDKLLTDVRQFISGNRLSDQVPCLSFGRYANISSDLAL